MIPNAALSGWRFARRAGHDRLKGFMLPLEASCVTVTEQLREPSAISSRRGRFCVHQTSKTIDSCVYLTSSGFVYPVLTDGPLPNEDQLRRKLKGVRHNLFCVMGVGRDVERIGQLFDRAAVETVSYYLMIRSAPIDGANPEMREGIRYRRASVSDAEAIYPIQRAYELEEVLVNTAHFDPGACMGQLRHSLKHQVVYIAESDRRVIAKAQTNARGYAWDQIGGVFTHPEFRSTGLGRNVMKALLAPIDRLERNTSLFVKMNNDAAVRMYRRLGYSTVDEFRICYYRGV